MAEFTGEWLNSDDGWNCSPRDPCGAVAKLLATMTPTLNSFRPAGFLKVIKEHRGDSIQEYAASFKESLLFETLGELFQILRGEGEEGGVLLHFGAVPQRISRQCLSSG